MRYTESIITECKLDIILVGCIKPGEIEIRCLLFAEWSLTEKFGLENVCLVVCV